MSMELQVVKLIKNANKHGVHDLTTGMDVSLSPLLVNSIRPFVFSQKEDEVNTCRFDENEIRALPFDICSIELEGEAAVFMPNCGMGDIWFLSCVCHEISPGQYKFYMLGSLDGRTPDAVLLVTEGAMYKALISLINVYIDRLDQGKMGICNYKKSILLGDKNLLIFSFLLDL